MPSTLTTEGPEQAVTVLDSLHIHIAVLDAQGCIVSINRAWQHFGQHHSAAAHSAPVGSSYLDACCDAGGGSGARAGIAAVLAGARSSFELEYACDAPGEPRWFLMRVMPLLGGGGGAVVTHDDISARWRLEQHHAALITELQTANRELSEFAYVVSHDLKAPLRGISSLASWLVTDHAEQLGSEGREHLGLIASRVKRLSGLIDAILAYSRAGRAREERTAVDLGPLLRNAIDLLAPPPHIQVEVADELPRLTVEAVKVQQVFQNLLSNAIDFMDKPAGRIRVTCRRDGDAWCFGVSDNGRGIETRHQGRIFQLFQTLSSRDEHERTGVGLALVKKIVELEGGRIWVDSEPGVGSSFFFTLPVGGA